jgi:hypothetical protein
MHWKAMMERDYLYAFDLQGKDVTLTIDKVTGGTLVGTGGKKTKKPLCFFREGQSGKPLALNSTNCKTIAALYGNDTDQWVGKRITIFPTTTQFGGDEVECIRVRPRVPPEKGARQPPPKQDEAGDPEPREPGSDG